MRSFTLTATGNTIRTHQSDEVFLISTGGRGRARNQEFHHRIARHCDGVLSLVSVPTVIALHPGSEVAIDGGTLTHGERITVDGEVYEITPRDLDGPVLTPVQQSPRRGPLGLLGLLGLVGLLRRA